MRPRLVPLLTTLAPPRPFSLSLFLFFLLLFSHLVVSDSLQPHGVQHARLPCPALSPEVYSNSCPLSRWCHPTISSSVTLFPSCPQSFPASRSFPVGCLFTSGGESIGASASVPPMNVQGWFPLGLTALIIFLSKGHWRVFSSTTFENTNPSALSLLYGPTLTAIHGIGKTIALTRQTFVNQVMSLLFNAV